MKIVQPFHRSLIAIVAWLMIFSSCSKDETEAPDITADMQSAIAIAATMNTDGPAAASDSIYAVNACKRGDKRIEVAESLLPATIGTYLSASYSGYTALKAFKIVDTNTEATLHYVVAIRFNDKPVALQFDADGTFVKVLELREKRNLSGRGWHLGGWFEHRDGKHRDTIAVASLPAAVKLYFSTVYPQDTLIHAAINKDASIIVLSKNNGYFATAFNAGSAFIKRVKLPAHPGRGEVTVITSLPASAQAYLTATYPNYVLQKAFDIKLNGVLKGYLVLIDANLTKYAIQFDAAGQFMSSVTIR